MTTRAASVDASPVSIRSMEPREQDVALFARCFAKNGSARTRETIEWQYLHNPTNKLFVDFAVATSGEIAAIYATLPVRLRVNGQLRLGTQSVDTITDANFRGRGLFLKLAASTYARAAKEGSMVVYGFPNGSSAHGFFERLQWTRLDPVPFLIRPLRARYVLERLKQPGLARLLPDVPLRIPGGGRVSEASTIERFDERFDSLWADAARDVGIATERDATYMNWRLLEKPGEAYVNRGIFERDRLIAFLSYTVKAKHGGHIGYIMEALCRPGHEGSLRALFREASSHMVDAGADVALAFCLPHSRPYRTYLRSGFVPFPERMRPIELHFGARALSPDGVVCGHRSSWYLSYLDSDTV